MLGERHLRPHNGTTADYYKTKIQSAATFQPLSYAARQISTLTER